MAEPPSLQSHETRRLFVLRKARRYVNCGNFPTLTEIISPAPAIDLTARSADGEINIALATL
jgi:hypothetical protein